MPSRKTSIAVSPTLEALIDKFAPLWTDPGPGTGKTSRVLQEAMERLDAHYRAEWRDFRELFTDGERDMMLSNAMSTAYTVAGLEGAVEADTADEDPVVFESFGVDRAVLLGKLRGLSRGQQYALVAWLEFLRAKVSE